MAALDRTFPLPQVNDIALAVKYRITVNFNVSGVAILIVVNMFYNHRFFGFLYFIKRAGVFFTTRLVAFMKA